MVGCSIRKCKSKSVRGGTISFYAFPREESLAKEWLRHCGPNTTVKNGRVCSIHFSYPSDFARPLRHIVISGAPTKYRHLKPDAVPTLHIDKTVEEKNTPRKSVDTDENISNVSVEAMIPIVEISCGDNSSECNTVPTYAIAGSSKDLLGQSIKCITIPLADYKQLKRTIKEYDTLKKNLENIFTPGQIRSLMKPKSKCRVKWSAEDIAVAASLKNISPKGYRHLRANLGIPLPAFSTLRDRTKCGMKKKLLEIFLCDENDETDKDKTEEDKIEENETEDDIVEDITDEGETEEDKKEKDKSEEDKTKEDIKTTLRVVNLSKLLDTN